MRIAFNHLAYQPQTQHPNHSEGDALSLPGLRQIPLLKYDGFGIVSMNHMGGYLPEFSEVPPLHELQKVLPGAVISMVLLMVREFS